MEEIEVPNDKFILDPCCANRTIWFTKDHPNTIYNDIRKEEKGFVEAIPNYDINPDNIMDFRALKYPKNSFKLIVWDPPHLDNLGKTAVMRKKYGCLNADTWRSDISKGFKELWRVLDDYGTLILKWNESRYTLKEVLSLFPETPLFGHTTGSKSKTKWVTFMKIPSVGKPPND